VKKRLKNLEKGANRWVIKTGFQNIIEARGQGGLMLHVRDYNCERTFRPA
jgi:hypothetical protein